jgi:hypothetical protein
MKIFYQLIHNSDQRNLFEKKKFIDLFYSKFKFFIPFKHIHCVSIPFSIEGVGLQTPPLPHMTF